MEREYLHSLTSPAAFSVAIVMVDLFLEIILYSTQLLQICSKVKRAAVNDLKRFVWGQNRNLRGNYSLPLPRVYVHGSFNRLVIDYIFILNKFTFLDSYPLTKSNDIVNQVSKFNYMSELDLKLAYHQILLHS